MIARCSFLMLLACLSMAVAAETRSELSLVIKDHQFQPMELVIPAGVKVVLIVDNQDSTPEEFESHELNREKVIPGNTRAKVFIGPLQAGVYPFFGEFHAETAQGKVIAK